MNIIEAREAAMAGKTVIAPNGTEFVGDDFVDRYVVTFGLVFGEWSVKQEPVTFEAYVEDASKLRASSMITFRCNQYLPELVRKHVRVTVEVIE